jgi:hypothetical protein
MADTKLFKACKLVLASPFTDYETYFGIFDSLLELGRLSLILSLRFLMLVFFFVSIPLVWLALCKSERHYENESKRLIEQELKRRNKLVNRGGND